MLLDLENFTFQANFGLFTVIKLAIKYLVRLIQEYRFRRNIANLMKKPCKTRESLSLYFSFYKSV